MVALDKTSHLSLHGLAGVLFFAFLFQRFLKDFAEAIKGLADAGNRERLGGLAAASSSSSFIILHPHLSYLLVMMCFSVLESNISLVA